MRQETGHWQSSGSPQAVDWALLLRLAVLDTELAAVSTRLPGSSTVMLDFWPSVKWMVE